MSAKLKCSEPVPRSRNHPTGLGMCENLAKYITISFGDPICGVHARKNKAIPIAVAERFKQKVDDHLRLLGAVATGTDFPQWKLETQVGALGVSVHGASIFQRLYDPKRALIVLDRGEFNLHSGKWNFHFEAASDDDFEYWRDQLGRVKP